MNTITEAIEAMSKGEIIIIVDNDNRENEGDFVLAIDHLDREKFNFFISRWRWLICAPICEDVCNRLRLDLMVEDSTAQHAAPFTVSVDLINEHNSTGVSVDDRVATIRSLVDKDTKPTDLGRPGHVLPLRACRDGVFSREWHTEASVDIAKLAGLNPGTIIVEILNEDGTVARLEELEDIAEQYNMVMVRVDDLIAYRRSQEENE